VPAPVPADHDDDDVRPAGAMPMALGWGAGAELRKPLGISIVGGLIVSQMLTLFTTPVIYLYLDRLRQALSWRTSNYQDRPSVLVPGWHRRRRSERCPPVTRTATILVLASVSVPAA